MRIGGMLFIAAALCVSAACTGKAEPSGPLGLTREDIGVPRKHAEKVLKVLESANDHNDRLRQMDQQLFAEDSH